MSRIRIVGALLVTGMLSVTLAARAEEGAPPDSHHQHWDFAAMHKNMCTEHMAHKAGKLGYMAAKLNLTSSQRALWNSYAQTVMASAASEEQVCLQEPAPNPSLRPTMLEHQSREVRMLQARLQAIQSEQPYLTKLYESLSPEQKTAMDEPMHGGWHHHMMGGEDHHMMDGPGHDHGPM